MSCNSRTRFFLGSLHFLLGFLIDLGHLLASHCTHLRYAAQDLRSTHLRNRSDHTNGRQAAAPLASQIISRMRYTLSTNSSLRNSAPLRPFLAGINCPPAKEPESELPQSGRGCEPPDIAGLRWGNYLVNWTEMCHSPVTWRRTRNLEALRRPRRTLL